MGKLGFQVLLFCYLTSLALYVFNVLSLHPFVYQSPNIYSQEIKSNHFKSFQFERINKSRFSYYNTNYFSVSNFTSTLDGKKLSTSTFHSSNDFTASNVLIADYERFTKSTNSIPSHSSENKQFAFEGHLPFVERNTILQSNESHNSIIAQNGMLFQKSSKSIMDGGADPGGDPTGNPLPISDDVLTLSTIALLYCGFSFLKDKRSLHTSTPHNLID